MKIDFCGRTIKAKQGLERDISLCYSEKIMKRRLVTSALPYVNNVPHLGNLIQVLSADAFARFCRLLGYETLYICGTDEYGTATETKAAEEGISPKELCDHYHKIHADIYKWFNIAFDKFGRTSTQIQTQVVHDIFKKLDEKGFIIEHTIEQLYCNKCARFLADRYVRGQCPHCGSEDARGDQCEACGKVLDPTDLKEPRCSACSEKPSLEKTKHLYLDLPNIKNLLEEWIKTASVEGFWAHNAIQMTQAWIRDGLRERAITRDLKWGIPVPKQGYEKKVFYVWFDAPIGYISITGNLGDETTMDWRSFVDKWWKKNDEVELFQFIGKDNIPFHTVIFPSSLLASGDKWTMLHHMSSTEYLNYESGKFSKSKGIGVFGSDAIETGIKSDVWRFYIFYNRPEKSDALFTWKDFQEKVNSELIGNLGNLINRTLSFVSRYYDGNIPKAEGNKDFWETVRKYEKSITEKLERADLRDAFREIFELSSYANKTFQEGEPWKMRKDNPPGAENLLHDLCRLVFDLAIMVEPYIPTSAHKIAEFFGKTIEKDMWKTLGKTQNLTKIVKSEVLFHKLEDEQIETLRKYYSGNQGERKMEEKTEKKHSFEEILDLRVAKIIKVEAHPKADKLYVLNLEIAGEERTIVSGLVSHYKPEDLLHKHIIVAYNLKPAKLRGIESRGMLLAAGDKDENGKERIEVLDAGNTPTGTKIFLEDSPMGTPPVEIDIDTFFSIPIETKNHIVISQNRNLSLEGKNITTSLIANGKVG